MAPHVQACSKKFALFLYENNYLDSFSISKKEARRIYMEEFKSQFKTKLSFYPVFYATISLLKKPKDYNIMTYNPQKLKKLRADLPTIEEQFEKGNKMKSMTLISQSFAFRSTSSRESIFTQKECKLCRVKFVNLKDYELHLEQESHLFLVSLDKALRDAKRRKKQSSLEFTVDDSKNLSLIARKNVPKNLFLRVKNVSKEVHEIVAVHTDSSVREVTFKLSRFPIEIAPATTLEFVLSFSSNRTGAVYFPMLFKIKRQEVEENFPVELVFHVHSDFLDNLHPDRPYKRANKPIVKEFIEHIDEGERPKTGVVSSSPLVHRLKPYPLVVDLALLMNAGLKPFTGITSPQLKRLDEIKAVLDVEDKTHCLKASNYVQILDLLLYFEEHQMNINIRDYDVDGQELKLVSKSNLLELEVPGLAEHRPSLVLGDAVCARENKDSNTIFRGYVHRVNETSVWLRFSNRFLHSVHVPKKKFYISFSFNRYPLKVEHQAVEFTKLTNIAHLFFPEESNENLDPETEIKWFNRDIESNPEQQQAVRAILQKTAMPSPYLVFGPPGTGKTSTIVEAIKQIYRTTEAKILVCTPSNSAANEITRRLVNFIPDRDVFRFIAMSFPQNQIPEEIKKIVNYTNGQFYQPRMETLLRVRVLITTLTTASKMLNHGCPHTHFAYVFIDESGQATETETLIPVAGIISSGKIPGSLSAQIVLAGDPKQLGPIVHSTLAQQYGFGVSMLERLMETCKPYQKDETSHTFNPNVLTKLVKNYRSHPILIDQPNKLFYENELQAAGDNLINLAINNAILPNPTFPIIFQNVVGIDVREKESPSFFNIEEVEFVVNYLEKLIGSVMQGLKITEKHVAVLSPYKKQVEKIRKACVTKGFDTRTLTIGSVEQIQGQERMVVILSTVRSRPDFLKYDSKFFLGFLKNPKRFNVAVTRAKALLIVVGNAKILQFDPCWKSFLTYCMNNSAMVGEKFEFDDVTNKLEEVHEALKEITLREEGDPEDGPNFSRGNL